MEQRKYVQLLLFGQGGGAPPKQKARKLRTCDRCKALVPKKPRSTMPVGHAVQTVMGIMASRLDEMGDDISRIVGEEVSEHAECPVKTLAVIAGRVVDALNYKFFPELYEDGEPYTPDPACRLDVPVNAAGLAAGSGIVPRLPTVAILARHWLERGKASPAAGLKMPDGKPLFTDGELARLGERQERRER